MSKIIDNIFSDVCLDSRIHDGIFRLDENEHMNALREYLIEEGGLTTEDAISITNGMLEGKYPDRQAYRKEDGILVTWPSPKHKANAMKENPGKYTDENPKKEEPEEPKEPSLRKPISSPTPSSHKLSSEPSSITQNGINFSIEPMHGDAKPLTPPSPPEPPVSFPKTPDEKAAEKVVVQQIIQGDDQMIPHHDPTLEENLKKSILDIINLIPNNKLQEVYNIVSKYGK